MELSEFEAQLKAFADEAHRGCGLVYELYVERFSGKVDGALKAIDPAIRDKAIELAENYGYESPEELAAGRRDADESGLCMHYLDPYHCPAGCGDIEHDR